MERASSSPKAVDFLPRNLAKLSGTNGKMVKIILDNPGFQSLEVGEDGNLHWKQVLQAAASRGAAGDISKALPRN